jgi:argininosuccinate lyase
MSTVNSAKLSSARFAQATDAFVEVFTASVDFDQRMAQQDIQGSIAHATMLTHCGILTEQERDDIISGLTQIAEEIVNGEFVWSIKQEDVHMNIEARLTDLIGIAGKKLHTGRSRNDQVATDIRLYLRSEIKQITHQLTRLQIAILDLAEQHADTIMPGLRICRSPSRLLLVIT